jgi:putative aldouronate transport system permease protein
MDVSTVSVEEDVKNKKKNQKWLTKFNKLGKQKFLLAMSLPFVIWVILFNYLPLFGWVMAFQDYKPGSSFLDQTWVGFKQFQLLFQDPLFYEAMENTLAMSILGLVFGTLFAIGFAVLLGELRALRYKKIVQTVSYLPHFVSWVVAATIITNILAPSGVVNQILVTMHLIKTPINFFLIPNDFWGIVTASNIWKEMGWNAIIYLAAITSIDPQLYEAATVDGASRIRQIFTITLPSIRPTIIVLLVMSIGNIVNIGFEQQFLLGNSALTDKSTVIDLYALNYGIGMFRYSYGTAIGIFKSAISVILLFLANQFAKKAGEGNII